MFDQVWDKRKNLNSHTWWFWCHLLLAVNYYNLSTATLEFRTNGYKYVLYYDRIYFNFGIVLRFRLSGESPFQGNNDNETLALVTAAQFEFDQESFEDISDDAKDFIGNLLKKDRRLVRLPSLSFFYDYNLI